MLRVQSDAALAAVSEESVVNKQPLETKPAAKSLTVVGATLVLIVTVAQIFGYDLTPLSSIENEVTAVVGAILTIIGRFRATKQITLL